MAASQTSSLGGYLASQAQASSSGETSLVSQQQLNIGPTVEDIWRQQFSKLSMAQQQIFSTMTCDGFDGYVQALATDCQALKDDSLASRISDWLEPIHRIATTINPAVKTATAAAGIPLPSDLILSGIRGILNLTKSIPEVQICAIQLLREMGIKANLLKEYLFVFSRNEPSVQEALIIVYMDIAIFCHAVPRYFNKQHSNAVKNFLKKTKASYTNDFRNEITQYVQTFSTDVDIFLAKAVALYGRMASQSLDLQQKTLHIIENYMQQEAQDTRRTEVLRIEQSRQQRLRNVEKERKRQRAMFKSCISWISNLSFVTDFENRCKQQLDGTCEWFLTSDRYTQWKKGEHSEVLWVRGNPGSGKSVLSAVSIHDLKNTLDPNVGVAYAFCKRNDQRKQTISALVGSMTRQLLETRDELSASIRDVYDQKGKRNKDIEDMLAFNLLDAATKMYSHCFLVIDAVDEFRDPSRLLDGLKEILNDRRSSRVLKILILSRTLSQTDSTTNGILDLDPKPVCPEIENGEDIKNYIESKLPGNEHAEARSRCIEKARGMFMWVQLLFQSFNVREANAEDILEIINSQLPGLNNMYEGIFQDLSSRLSSIRDRAWLVLFWILDAYRPLEVDEMREAVGGYTNIQRVVEIKKNPDGQSLVELCRNLVYIDSEGYFSFIHASVKDYLETSNPQSPILAEFQAQRKTSHNRLASICLGYLQLQDFDEFMFTIHDLSSYLGTRPFAEYAARFWGRHVADGDTELHVANVLSLVQSASRRELSLQLIWYSLSKPKEFWAYHESTSELHCLALFNLPEIAEALMARAGTLMYHTDGNDMTPLMYAAKSGSQDMAIWLLNRLNRNRTKEWLRWELDPVITAASARGWTKIFTILNEIDTSLISNGVAPLQHTPLQIACLVGDQCLAKHLIQLGADLTVKSAAGENVLSSAVSENLDSVVELVVARQPELINIQDDTGNSALHHAAANDNEAIMIALLGRGAKPYLMTSPMKHNAAHVAAANNSSMALLKIYSFHPNFDFATPSMEGYTTMHVAALNNAVKAAKCLIDMPGGKTLLEKPTSSGFTPLHIAAENGCLEMVEYLVQRQCSVLAATDGGRTALHIAAANGSHRIVAAILENTKAATIDELQRAQDTAKSTALHLACSTTSKESVKILIENRADVSQRGLWDATALHYAAIKGDADVCEIVLRNTKDVNPRDDRGHHPFHFATSSRKFDFVNRYIKICAELKLTIDISSPDNEGQTPLFAAAAHRDSMIVDLLLPLTPSSTFDFVTSDKTRLIHLAAEGGHEALMGRLLELSDSTMVGVPGYHDFTPLLCAISGGRLDMVKTLAPLSDLEAKNDTGHTALLLALACNHLSIVQYLLTEFTPNVHALTKENIGALHYTAEYGNAEVFEKLLQLGCRSFGAESDGRTPLHTIAANGQIRMVKLLEQYGFDDFQGVDCDGDHAINLAAIAGRTAMFRELKRLGCSLEVAGLAGFNAAHRCAERGHLSALNYLKENKVNIHATSTDGITPFYCSVSSGSVSTAEYLLEDRPEIINEHRGPHGENVMMKAIAMCRYETARLLASKSPSLWFDQDKFGITAKEVFVNQNIAEGYTFLAQVLPEQVISETPLSDRAKEELRAAAIKADLRAIRAMPVPMTKYDGRNFVRALNNLSTSLRIANDTESLKLCQMLPCFQDKASIFNYPPTCDCCWTYKWTDEVCICLECYDASFLCLECYDAYMENELDCPTSLKYVLELENSVRKVRIACEEMADIVDVDSVMCYFPCGSQFISETLTSYERWQEAYQVEDRYTSLIRPGQQWLKLLQEFSELKTTLNFSEEDAETCFRKVEDIRWRYITLNGRYDPNLECNRFRCKGHEYISIKRKDYDDLKSAGIFFDSATGSIKEELFNTIAKKHDPDSSLPSKLLINNDSAQGRRAVSPLARTQSMPLNTGLPRDYAFTRQASFDLPIVGRSNTQPSSIPGININNPLVDSSDLSSFPSTILPQIRNLSGLQGKNETSEHEKPQSNGTSLDPKTLLNEEDFFRPGDDETIGLSTEPREIEESLEQVTPIASEESSDKVTTNVDNVPEARAEDLSDVAVDPWIRAKQAADRRVATITRMANEILQHVENDERGTELMRALLVADAISPGLGSSLVRSIHGRLRNDGKNV